MEVCSRQNPSQSINEHGLLQTDNSAARIFRGARAAFTSILSAGAFVVEKVTKVANVLKADEVHDDEMQHCPFYIVKKGQKRKNLDDDGDLDVKRRSSAIASPRSASVQKIQSAPDMQKEDELPVVSNLFEMPFRGATQAEAINKRKSWYEQNRHSSGRKIKTARRSLVSSPMTPTVTSPTHHMRDEFNRSGAVERDLPQNGLFGDIMGLRDTEKVPEEPHESSFRSEVFESSFADQSLTLTDSDSVIPVDTEPAVLKSSVTPEPSTSVAQLNLVEQRDSQLADIPAESTPAVVLHQSETVDKPSEPVVLDDEDDDDDDSDIEVIEDDDEMVGESEENDDQLQEDVGNEDDAEEENEEDFMYEDSLNQVSSLDLTTHEFVETASGQSPELPVYTVQELIAKMQSQPEIPSTQTFEKEFEEVVMLDEKPIADQFIPEEVAFVEPDPAFANLPIEHLIKKQIEAFQMSNLLPTINSGKAQNGDTDDDVEFVKDDDERVEQSEFDQPLEEGDDDQDENLDDGVEDLEGEEDEEDEVDENEGAEYDEEEDDGETAEDDEDDDEEQDEEDDDDIVCEGVYTVKKDAVDDTEEPESDGVEDDLDRNEPNEADST